jgi:hypothetical protein
LRKNFKWFSYEESISNTVMEDVPNDPIGGSKTRFVGTVSQTVRSGNGPYINVPYPSSPSHGFLHHTIGSLNNAKRFYAITFGNAISEETMIVTV